MSILIKGMTMPKDCESCSVAHPAECELWMTAGYRQRHKDCPLVEVPTPHGPLIDANEIIEVQMLDEMYDEWTLKTMSVAEYLAFAADMPPTIIEAEEGEEA